MTTELHIPPLLEYQSLLAAFVSDAALRAQLDEGQRAALTQAATLGFACIVRDAMAAERQPVRARAHWTPAELCIGLLERGSPLDDASAARDPQWDEVRSRVDRAYWILHGRHGSELQLAVTRPHGFTNGKAPQSPEESVPLAPQQSYTVRRFQPADAAGVARAFYETWGYHYIFPAVYVPQRLIELNDANAYISIVAVSEGEEIVGHYALDPVPGTPVADACAAIVVPAHRGRGLLELMRQATEDEAIRLNFAAYYSEPVTAHGRTQQESAKFGAHLCAIVLGGDPKTFVPKAMAFSGAGQRQSYTVYFKPLAPRASRAIYAPAGHRSMIETIYANLALPVEFRDGGAPSGEGELRVQVTRGEGFATIDVFAVGSATEDQLRQAVTDLRSLAHLGALYINLPLEDPGTPHVCEAAERLGFFFCGVIPWVLNGHDAMRLQMPLTPIDLSQVTIISAFGEQLKNYIYRSSQESQSRVSASR